MEINLTFYDWLILINPNAHLKITTSEGLIYIGKNDGNLNYHMSLAGIKFNINT